MRTRINYKRTIKGKEYRYNFEKNIMVCENGWGFFREYYNEHTRTGADSYWLKRQEDDEGNIYVLTHDYGRLRADELVATCFCKPKPEDGREYDLHHKDGKKGNCSRGNLEWRASE